MSAERLRRQETEMETVDRLLRQPTAEGRAFRALFDTALDHENRLRALEGKSGTATATDLRDAVAARRGP